MNEAVKTLKAWMNNLSPADRKAVGEYLYHGSSALTDAVNRGPDALEKAINRGPDAMTASTSATCPYCGKRL